jgi:hypothetical protein
MAEQLLFVGVLLADVHDFGPQGKQRLDTGWVEVTALVAFR